MNCKSNNKYDVVIVGGGVSGCATAYIAAKLGLKPLLIEKSTSLGGAITSGLVIPVMKSGDNQINTEFYHDLVATLHDMNGQITYCGNSGWFNPILVKFALDKMLTRLNVDIRFSTEVIDANINDFKIKSIKISDTILSPYNYKVYNDNINITQNDILSEYIDTEYIVDATGDAIFSRKINCEFLNSDDNYQPVSLRFLMSGVDIFRLGEWLTSIDSNRDVTTYEIIDNAPHLSTAYTWDTDKNWALKPIFDKGVKEGYITNEDRNYFQIFSVAGMPNTIAFNCPRLTSKINPNLNSDITKALIQGRQSIYRIAKFCNKYFVGFENAYISTIADSLGVRVSNRIKGKYVYTIDDLRSGKKFKNPVLISNYPVDVHSATKNASTLEMSGEYQLPIESLMSANYNNLFIVGRCLSADYLAQGALRVQSSCFSMGEGVARYISNILKSN